MASVHLARPFTQRPAQPPQIMKSGISLISTEYQREKFSHLNDHLCNDLGEGRFFDLPALPRGRKNRGSPKLFFSTEYPSGKFSPHIPRVSAILARVEFSTSQPCPDVKKSRFANTHFLDGFATRKVVSSHPQTFSDFREGRFYDSPAHLGSWRGSKSCPPENGEGQNLAVSFYARVRIVRSLFLLGVNNWLTSFGADMAAATLGTDST